MLLLEQFPVSTVAGIGAPLFRARVPLGELGGILMKQTIQIIRLGKTGTERPRLFMSEKWEYSLTTLASSRYSNGL